MPAERTAAMFRKIIPGLAAGGVCGAAIALELVPANLGIAAAIGVGVYVFLAVRSVRRRYG